MRTTRIILDTLLAGCIAFLAAAQATAVPLVAFQPDSMSVTASGTFQTPAIIVSGATGVSMITLNVTIPQGVSISSATSAGNLACVTPGASVSGLFFSEWDSVGRKISITCSVTPGATLELVRSIQFTTSADIRTCQVTLGGSVTGGSGPGLFGSLTLIPPHTLTISSCAADPAAIDSAGTTACNTTAVDSASHALAYTWSDGGRGGSFTPSASVQSPTYVAPANYTGSSISVTLRCTVACAQNATVTRSATANLTVRSAPPKTIDVTSTPNAGASIVFSPSPDSASKASPKPAPVTLTYQSNATGIQITAARQDGATRPLWFDHWTYDGVDVTPGQLTISVGMGGSNHTAQAVYGSIVGDLNGDGTVDKADAQIILSAVMGDIAKTNAMDVDMSGTVDLKDSRWILQHRS